MHGRKLSSFFDLYRTLRGAIEMAEEDSHAKLVIKTRYKLCPSCRNFVVFSEDQVFCIVCGEKLLEECPTCSEPILYPTARFCQVCGTPLVRKANTHVD
jgi:predicted amidophosphoribosyltransferase